MLPGWTITIKILELVRDEDEKVIGLIVSNDVGSVVEEYWTEEACKLLVEAGEMKYYEPEECPTSEQLERLFNNQLIA